MSALSCCVTCGIVVHASHRCCGRLAPHAAHGDALDFPQLGEVGKLRLREMCALRAICAAATRSQQRLGVSLDIVFADASAGAGAFHVVDVHADFARQAPDVRRGGNRCAMLRARHFAQLLRHGESFGRMRLRAGPAGIPALRSCPRPGSRPETTSELRAVRRCARPARASAFSGCADAPPSRVKITWPTLIFSPSLTLISFTVPVTEDGTSTTALSVSSSITGWPSETLEPGEIISRTRSP